MPKIPTRFHGPALLTNAAATKLTVAAGEKAIIRHIHIDNPGAAIDLTLSVGADAAATRLFDGHPLTADSPYDWYGYLVLDAAEVIQAFASVTNQATITINGDRVVLG